MKCYEWGAFVNHLATAPSCRIYFVACPSDADRCKITEEILAKLPPVQVVRHSADGSVEQVLAQLNTYPMLQERAVIYDLPPTLRSPQVALLKAYLQHPAPFSYLILRGAALRSFEDLYQKEGVLLLSLCGETSWQRQRRLKEWLLCDAKREQKSVSPELLDALLTEGETDYFFLAQELAKCIAFAYDKQRVELADAQCVGLVAHAHSLRQFVDAALNGEALIPSMHTHDASFAYAFVAMMRMRLRGRSKSLDRRFFTRALQALFDLELNMKNTSHKPVLLVHDFILRLQHARNSYPSCESAR